MIKMPHMCVVYGCSNVVSEHEGISLHVIPYANDERVEAKRRRKRWVDFVGKKRRNFEPTATSKICSRHFQADDFVRRLDIAPTSAESRLKPTLRRDEVGICVFPTISFPDGDGKKRLSARDRRHSLVSAKRSRTFSDEVGPEEKGQHSTSKEMEMPSTSEVNERPSTSVEVEVEMSDVSTTDDQLTSIHEHNKDGWCQTESMECKNCSMLKLKLFKSNEIISLLRSKLKFVDDEEYYYDEYSMGMGLCDNNDNNSDSSDDEGSENGNSTDDSFQLEDYSTETEEEPNIEEEMYTSEEEPENEHVTNGKRVLANDENIRKEPKFVVFLSQLLQLFQVCATCKNPGVLVELKEFGTMVQVETTCSNERCPQKSSIWKSQPVMPGTLISAGNLLLSFAILVAGGTASKVIRIFEHMGLGCISLATFFRHQRTKLFPAIHLHWSSCQSELSAKINDAKPIVVSGDGRHDSMGHSAKYCAYSLFCHEPFNAIFDFSLVQRNEAGSSPAMEYVAFSRSLENISKKDISMDTFVSDRHTTIAKHFREKLPKVNHYFDLWHLVKKVSKVLNKIAKEKDCEALLPWIKPCVNHLYWSVTTTLDGNGKAIWAKFESFLEHIANVHSNLPNPLFNKCAHGDEITERTWLHKDSVVYEKLCTALLNKRLRKGICQASPLSQTSCLEGFYSVLNHFCPKMIAYSFRGMYCRYILAICHFNCNLQRDERKTESGKVQVKVVYPKFKNGEATVRSVRVLPNFDYVEEIFKVMCHSDDKTLQAACRVLVKMTPAPMNTMLEKQSREEAIDKSCLRKEKVSIDVPATELQTQESVVPQDSPVPQVKERVTPHCRTCGNPMKGHGKIKDCPKNIEARK